MQSLFLRRTSIAQSRSFQQVLGGLGRTSGGLGDALGGFGEALENHIIENHEKL